MDCGVPNWQEKEFVDYYQRQREGLTEDEVERLKKETVCDLNNLYKQIDKMGIALCDIYKEIFELKTKISDLETKYCLQSIKFNPFN